MSEAQLVIVGLVASALVWILRQINALGTQPKREVVAVALYVVSFGLAIFFTPVSIPPFGGFSDAPSFIAAALQWVGELLAVASPVAGFAFLIYNVLLQRVLEGAKSYLGRKG